jgi:type VI protein secretion system component Hcp
MAQGGQALFLEWPQIFYKTQDPRVPLRSASLQLGVRTQAGVQGEVPVMLISRDIDHASTRLINLAAEEEVVGPVVLTVVVNSGGQPRNLMVWTLKSVKVLSYAAKIPAESGVASAGSEELTLRFGEIAYEVTTIGPTGVPGQTVTDTYKVPGQP